jgi:hypothetical protein
VILLALGAWAAPPWLGPPVEAGPVTAADGVVRTLRVRVYAPEAREILARHLASRAELMWARMGDRLNRFPREHLDVMLVGGVGPAHVDVRGDRVVLPADPAVGIHGDVEVRLARAIGSWIAIKRVAGLSEPLLGGVDLVAAAEGAAGGMGAGAHLGGGPPPWWIDAVGEAAAAGAGWGAVDPARAHRLQFRTWPAWVVARSDRADSDVGAAVAIAFDLDLDALIEIGESARRVGWHRALTVWLGEPPEAAWDRWRVAGSAPKDAALPTGRLTVRTSGLGAELVDGERVVLTVAAGAIGRASVSPDGTAAVVAVRAVGRQDLWTVGLDGGEPLAVTRDGHAERSPVWTEQGVWFIAAPDGTDDVYLRHPDGHITRHTHGLGAWSLTPNGEVIGPWGAQPVPLDGEGVYGVFRTTPVPDLRGELDHAPQVAPLTVGPVRWARAVGSVWVDPGARLEGDIDGLRVRAGAGVTAAGVRRWSAARLDGWLGEDLAAGLAWSVGRPALRLTASGGGAVDRRGALVGDGIRRTVRAGGLRLDGGPVHAWAGFARLDLGGAPAGDTTRAGVGWSAAAGPLEIELDALGGWSVWADRSGPWARGTGRASVTLPGPGRVRLTAEGGATAVDVHPEEELRLGGVAPLVLRQALLESSVALPGWAPYALSGDAIGVGRIDSTWPIAPGGGTIGGWTSHSAAITIGGDVATIVPRPEDLGPLVDVTVGLQMTGDRAGRPLDVAVLAAFPTTAPMAPRAYLVLGSL